MGDLSDLVDVPVPADLPGASRGLRAYVARPPGEGPFPGVVMVHEAFGLDDVMRRSADHLAAMGYVVAAPDLFGAGRRLPCLVATFRSLRAGSGPAFDDLEATRRMLLGRDDATGGVGVIGFCMGGAFALLLAQPGRGYDVASVNYGMLAQGDAQLDALAGGCPVVASYGAKDKALADVPAKLAAALEAHGTPYDVRLYGAAGHSFLNDAENAPWWLRPMMRVQGAGPEPASAADAWRRIGEFFGTHLPR